MLVLNTAFTNDNNGRGRSRRAALSVRRFLVEVRDEIREVIKGARADIVRMDDSYQKFVAKKVDPILGRPDVQVTGIAGLDESVTLSDRERQLNRYVGAAAITIGTAVISVVYPPTLLATVGTALYSTQRVYRRAYTAVVRDRKMRIEVLGAIYFTCAYAGGFFVAGSLGVAGFFISEKLLCISEDRSRKRLTHVFSQQPGTVWKLLDGVEVEVPFASVRAGETIVLQAGATVPVDGVVLQGNAIVEERQLTGEGQPVEKGEGDTVLASTLVVAGKIHVRTEKTGEGTVASNIVTILNNTSSYQAGIVSKAERFAEKAVTPTLALSLIALPFSGYRFMVTIMGSCPGNSVRITAPLAMLNFLNVAASHGILIKDGRSLELLREVDTVIFDKTGTLTMEQPEVAEVHSCGDVDEDTLLIYAAAAEHRQTHPIARAILAEAYRRGLSAPEVEDAEYEVGYGLRVRLDGHLIRVGSRRFMALENIWTPPAVEALQEAAYVHGHSLVLVAIDDRVAGIIELVPALRPEAKEVVQDLRRRGMDLYIISGDHDLPTRHLSRELDIPAYFADTLPKDKAALVERLQKKGRVVCFVGDGINDAIALKKANVSVSMRGAAAAATQAAQIVLMEDSLRQFPFAFDLANQFKSNVKAATLATVIPDVIKITGAMLALVAVLPGTAIWLVGLTVGIRTSMKPLSKHRQVEL